MGCLGYSAGALGAPAHAPAYGKALVSQVGDNRLAEHLQTLYAARLAYTEETLARGLVRAIDHVVDELLRVDEQMSLIDYEIGAGLMKPGGNRAGPMTARLGRVALRLGPGVLPASTASTGRRTRRFRVTPTTGACE